MTALDLITAAQKADFSLDEIRTLIPAGLAQWPCDSLLEALHRKVRDIEALEARLARSKAQVMSLIAEIAAKPASVDVQPMRNDCCRGSRRGMRRRAARPPPDCRMAVHIPMTSIRCRGEP